MSMALRNLNFSSLHAVTATVATTATVAPARAIEVAKVATVAGAEPKDSKNAPDPKAPCLVCAGGQFWRSIEGGAWHCRSCQPAMPLTATTLTMACYQSSSPRRRARRRPRRRPRRRCPPSARVGLTDCAPLCLPGGDPTSEGIASATRTTPGRNVAATPATSPAPNHLSIPRRERPSLPRLHTGSSNCSSFMLLLLRSGSL
jgi:hypothetical protein